MNPASPPPPSDPSRPEFNMDYWVRSSTLGGRLSIRLRYRAKLLLWKSVLFFAHGLKRVLDIAGAAAALLIASPVFAIVGILIKLEDGGPVFFSQPRVGLNGRLFPVWKFRSMVVNAEALKDQLRDRNEMQGGVIFKMKDDPRITRIGRFIRKYSIDELPQFWNVFVGEMSLVGPRPPVPKEVAEYSPEDRLRLLVKPGITCLWQVSGRSEIDFSGQVRLDLAYIRSSNIWTDCKLLLRTIPAVLLGKGAY